jgi:hypothetical protein
MDWLEEADDQSEAPETTTEASEDDDMNTSTESEEAIMDEPAGDTGPSLAELVPEAMTLEEAQEKDYRWRMMVWGSPACGKSHFAYTMPSPIAFIDTEGKAEDIAHKFEGDVVIYQPQDYEEALDSLKSAIEALDIIRSQTGKVGTIVVDSMSIMWEWSQQHYVDIYHPGKDVEDVNFKSGLQGNSDWKQIKRFHNKEFRQRMLDTPYHILWTAMREDDYEKVFDNGETADKPGGEKNNRHKIDQVIRLKQNSEGRRVGHLQKSGFIRHEYRGLEYPTFDKHRAIVEAIAEAEESVSVEEDITKIVDLPYDVAVIDGGSEN